jgi:hypothetical protein
MTSENYIEHVLSSLSLKPREDLQEHLSRLDSILARIEDVPSPEKEDLLIELILTPQGRASEAEHFHSSP